MESKAFHSLHARPGKFHQSRLTSEEQDRRKSHILTRSSPSTKLGIASAITIKDEDVFFLCQHDGLVPRSGEHGLGLYYHDCRYLGTYQFTIQDQALFGLAATARAGFRMVIEVVNPELEGNDGQPIARESLGFKIDRLLSGQELALIDRITITNYGPDPAEFTLGLEFGSQFEDVFAVRGLVTHSRGILHPRHWLDDVLRLRYDGCDGLIRWADIVFSKPPDNRQQGHAEFDLAVPGKGSCDLLISIRLGESLEPPPSPTAACFVFADVCSRQERRQRTWIEGHTKIVSSSPLFNRVLE
ncbi:MAG: hypothetical protein KGR26_07660, partial [Cyanobacteria bacterium REEB65]|nr:hypothetical protein [Cyanobacteria bacterium REEB65]